jgi:threonine/homoserine/homoserine lactone efflux protein
MLVGAKSFATLESGPTVEMRALCVVLMIAVTWCVVVSGTVLTQVTVTRLTRSTKHRARGK